MTHGGTGKAGGKADGTAFQRKPPADPLCPVEGAYDSGGTIGISAVHHPVRPIPASESAAAFRAAGKGKTRAPCSLLHF